MTPYRRFSRLAGAATCIALGLAYSPAVADAHPRLSASGASATRQAFTHGPDPVGDLGDEVGTPRAREQGAQRLGRSASWCGSRRSSDDGDNEVDNGSGRWHVVYARASDQADRFERLASYIEGAALESSEKLVRARGRALRYDLGTDCGPRNVDISAVALRSTAADLDRDRNGGETYWKVAGELSGRGFNASDKNYLVFVDAPERHYCGEGAGFGDDRRDPENHNQGGGRFAIVYRPFDTAGADGGFCGGAALHEQLHVLGIVPPAAPHNDGGGHCNDAREDVMCGSAPQRGGGPYVDWNSDDYWDPQRGQLGWWTANLSRFVCPDAGCNSGEEADFLPPTPSGYSGPRYSVRFHNVDDEHCASAERASDRSWRKLFCVGYQGDREEEITGALVALSPRGGPGRLRIVARNHDPGGGRTLGVTLRRVGGPTLIDERAGQAGSQSSDLPESDPDPDGHTTFYDRTEGLDLNLAPQAAFSVSPSAPRAGDVVTLRSSSSDPDGSLAKQAWELDGDFDFDDAFGPSASRRFEQVGEHVVGLRVTDDHGARAEARRTLVISAADPTPPPPGQTPPPPPPPGPGQGPVAPLQGGSGHSPVPALEGDPFVRCESERGRLRAATRRARSESRRVARSYRRLLRAYRRLVRTGWPLRASRRYRAALRRHRVRLRRQRRLERRVRALRGEVARRCG